MNPRSISKISKAACALALAAMAVTATQAAPKPKTSMPAVNSGERGASPPTRLSFLVLENGPQGRRMKWICLNCDTTTAPGHPSEGMGTQSSGSTSTGSGQTSFSNSK